MGACAARTAPHAADAGGGDLNGEEAGGKWRSRIFGPPSANSRQSYPALVVVQRPGGIECPLVFCYGRRDANAAESSKTRLAAPKSGPQVHGMCDEHVGWLLMQPLAKELAKLGFVVPRRRRNLGETKPALADSQAAAGVVLFETPSRY